MQSKEEIAQTGTEIPVSLRQTARSASVHHAAVLCGVEGVDGCAVLFVSSVLRAGRKRGMWN